jgi:hypothetical protein
MLRSLLCHSIPISTYHSTLGNFLRRCSGLKPLTVFLHDHGVIAKAHNYYNENMTKQYSIIIF